MFAQSYDKLYSLMLDCKTVGFFSKSVKKSVKRAVRVLRARSARASHARRACEVREKRLREAGNSNENNVCNGQSVFLESLPRSRSLSLVPDLLFDCSRVLEYAKIRTVLQSTLMSATIACQWHSEKSVAERS